MGFVYGAPNALEIQGRRKVSDEKAAIQLQEELEKKLTAIKDSGKEPIIADLDLSQNHCPPDLFESLFSAISSQNTPVHRLRLFGIPTMTDEAVEPLAAYLRSVPPEAAPFELHLSDCALTTVGFSALMDAIEENSAFPCVNPGSEKKQPLYLRLENNYIEPSALQEKVDAKVIKIFIKDRTPGKLVGEEKVLLVKKQNQVGFSQKEGMPPAPEEVEPVRTQVYDWRYHQNQQKTWGGPQVPQQFWQKPQQSWQKPQQSWQPKQWVPQQPQWQKPQQAQWQKPQWNQQKGKGGEKSKPATSGALIKPVQTAQVQQTAGKGACKWCATGQCWSHPGGKASKGAKGGKGAVIPAPVAIGGGKNSNDRSRTPAPRGGKSGPTQPQKPPPGAKKPSLPAPWQEQFSDEFQIPYYWNPDTLESSWEIPHA